MQAWVTLATNDTYALGALVLGQSLRKVKTSRQLCILVTDGVTQGMREHLSSVFDQICLVNVFDSKDEENLGLIQRPDLGVTFTKLHCWRLTHYEKCVFLDADTLVLQNSDELFVERDEFSAAPDIGWPDMFNSGVFVFKPSLETYRALVRCAMQHGSFDGGDQGLLNTYFSNFGTWESRYRLPFTYNMSSSAIYTYTAAYKKYGKDVKIVHFIGSVKPWQHKYSKSHGDSSFSEGSGHLPDHMRMWWNIYHEGIGNKLQPEYTALAGAQAEVSEPRSDLDRKRAWEAGHADYMGSDSWENIQKKLDHQLTLEKK